LDTIAFGATISEAAEKMSEFDIGILPIEKGNKITGMITDRDIVIRVIAKHMVPDTTPVNKVMTPDVISCFEDEELDDAARKMEKKQVRRLLVLDRNNMPCGILSLSDIAVKACNEHMSYEILEKVCEPVSV
jgi:CBS domain-containing protein